MKQLDPRWSKTAQSSLLLLGSAVAPVSPAGGGQLQPGVAPGVDCAEPVHPGLLQPDQPVLAVGPVQLVQDGDLQAGDGALYVRLVVPLEVAGQATPSS